MKRPQTTYPLASDSRPPILREDGIEAGFIGTPILEENAAQQKIEDTQASMKTREDLFQKQLHAYTITHAIEDKNVLRFHIDYFKPTLGTPTSPSASPASGPTRTSALPAPTKRAVIEAILAKHDARKLGIVIDRVSFNFSNS